MTLTARFSFSSAQIFYVNFETVSLLLRFSVVCPWSRGKENTNESKLVKNS